MKILFLAPQPFYQERGTPIAVRLAASVLGGRENTQVTLMTYQEGKSIALPNVTHKRSSTVPKLSDIQPGFSLKKLYADFFLASAAIKEIYSHKESPYQIIHAVEESVFIALLIKWIFKVPYIYDMDSSLSEQLAEKFPWISCLSPIFQALEGLAIRNSTAVIPVCDALQITAQRFGAKRIQTLRDISLLNYDQDSTAITDKISLRKEAGLSENAQVVLYVGNLENYQGIDLLVEAFAKIWEECTDASLVVIGGSDEHVKQYQQKAKALNIPDSRCLFIGPRPVSQLSAYLKQATILTSPRTLGNNTPMKIYSYLHSGVPILATSLPTHTQVLNEEVAKLASPDPDSFGTALKELLLSKQLQQEIGSSAFQLAEQEYTFEVFKVSLNQLYDSIDNPKTLSKNSPATA